MHGLIIDYQLIHIYFSDKYDTLIQKTEIKNFKPNLFLESFKLEILNKVNVQVGMPVYFSISSNTDYPGYKVKLISCSLKSPATNQELVFVKRINGQLAGNFEISCTYACFDEFRFAPLLYLDCLELVHAGTKL